MSRVTIFIPISRADHLDRLFHSLEALECDTDQTTLLTYIDGDRRLFDHVKVLTLHSKFKEPQCILRPSKAMRPGPLHNKEQRRYRIADIKNESRYLIPDCMYVFSIEDDTIVPPHALSRLLADYDEHPYAGFIEGVELGRWGIVHVGAWKVNDPVETTTIESVLPTDGLTEIDAGGFYCYLTRYETYARHEYKVFSTNILGPDVDFGLGLRRQGMKNFIDWSIDCEHFNRRGYPMSLANTKPCQVTLVKGPDRWEQKLHNRVIVENDGRAR